MTPEQQAYLISQSAQGASCRTIADRTGIPKSTINDAQQQLRPYIIEEATALLNDGLGHARRTVVYNASRGYIDDATIDDRKLGLDASKIILNAAQITGQGNPSTIINAIIQVNQAPEQGEAIGLLQQFLAARMSDPQTLSLTPIPQDRDDKTSVVTDMIPLPSHNPEVI